MASQGGLVVHRPRAAAAHPPCKRANAVAGEGRNSLVLTFPLVFWPCASPTTKSGTAHSPWTPRQVASGALLGSSLARFGFFSSWLESTWFEAALARSVSSGTCPFALPSILYLIFFSQSAATSFLIFSPQPRLGCL